MVYAGLSLCSRKLWCGTSTLCTGLLMQHLSVPPHQCGGGGGAWALLRGDCICRLLCAWVRPPEWNALLTVVDPGEVPSPPTLFSDQTEAWRAEKFFFGDRALLISRSGSGTRLYGKNCPLGLNGQSVILRCLYSQEGGGLPLMAYMGRLCPKGVPFPGLRYMKG